VKVLTIEKPMTASLRGHRFQVTASWTPADPHAITLVSPHGETWTLSREVIALALAGERMDRAAFDAAEIEAFRAEDELEITRYFKSFGPVPVWFAAADWQQLLDDTTSVIPLGDERSYIDWHAEFPEVVR